MFLIVLKGCHKLASDPTAATNLLKYKIQVSKFEDLLSFIRQITSQVASSSK